MSKQLEKVRRSDRQETDISFLHSLLDNSLSCSVAIATDEFPLVQNTFFVFDKASEELMFHFSKYGFAGQEIQSGKKATISLHKYGKFYTAQKAVDFGCEYQSIVMYGKIRIVESEEERMQAMQIFFDRYFGNIPKSDFRDFTSSEANPIHVAKVRIEKWFGKQHLVPDKALASFYSHISTNM